MNVNHLSSVLSTDSRCPVKITDLEPYRAGCGAFSAERDTRRRFLVA